LDTDSVNSPLQTAQTKIKGHWFTNLIYFMLDTYSPTTAYSVDPDQRARLGIL